MKVLYSWLQEFVPVTASAEEVRARLALSGTAIDAIDETPAGPVLDAEGRGEASRSRARC